MKDEQPQSARATVRPFSRGRRMGYCTRQLADMTVGEDRDLVRITPEQAYSSARVLGYRISILSLTDGIRIRRLA